MGMVTGVRRAQRAQRDVDASLKSFTDEIKLLFESNGGANKIKESRAMKIKQ